MKKLSATAAVLSASMCLAPHAQAGFITRILYQAAPPAGDTLVNVYGVTSAGVVYGAVAPSISNPNPDAVIWPGNSNFIDLDNGTHETIVMGASGNQQVGIATINGQNRGMLWNGSAASLVDLTPAGTAAIVKATDGVHQVGGAGGSAILWHGSATDYVNLAPTNLSGVAGSEATALFGNRQGGWIDTTSGAFHATLWSGTADSAVDINPSTVTNSFIFGMSANQQVGAGDSYGVSDHAFVWNGTAASAVDLSPNSYSNSDAYFTNGSFQVGDLQGVATQWFGTANSAVNLQALLPSGNWTRSVGYSIDSSGDIFGIATGTYNGTTGTFAVEWAVPEPASLLLGSCTCLLIGRRNRVGKILS